MDDIIVIDNFLNKEELSHVQDVNTYMDSHWQIHNSAKDQDVFDFNTPFLSKNLMDTEYYTSYLFNKIKKIFKQDYKLVDVYLNGHEALRHGSFHTDGDADRTVILYITPWQPAWGGFTQFMKSERDHVIVPPILGRLINFRSNILHKAYAYCNQNCPMRITVAFKLKL
tara:strand:- start:14 stop:520 length:507 start_codon:yes stop_codon:yes gene_type:complete